MRQKPSSVDDDNVFFFLKQKSSSIILLETKTFLKNLEKIRPNMHFLKAIITNAAAASKPHEE